MTTTPATVAVVLIAGLDRPSAGVFDATNEILLAWRISCALDERPIDAQRGERSMGADEEVPALKSTRPLRALRRSDPEDALSKARHVSICPLAPLSRGVRPRRFHAPPPPASY